MLGLVLKARIFGLGFVLGLEEVLGLIYLVALLRSVKTFLYPINNVKPSNEQ